MDYLLRSGSYVNCPEPTPDCILLDINMPLLDGFGALQRIKNFPEFKNIPIYMLTTSMLQEHKEKAISFGANGFYSKVCDLDKLKAIFSRGYWASCPR